MVIYSYYADVGFLGFIFYTLLSVAFLAGTIWQIVKIVKFCLSSVMREVIVELLVRIVILLVSTILLVGFAINAAKLGTAYYLYKTQNYMEVRGTLSLVSAERNDYRGNELYDISFYVEDTMFENTNISCTRELLNKLIDLDGEMISVTYLTGIVEQGEPFIISIVQLSD